MPGLLIQLGPFGAAFVGFSIIADWRAGVIERYRVTPVSRLALPSGRVLRDALTLLAQAVVLVLAGLAFGLRAPIGGVLIGLAFMAMVAISLAGISYTVTLLFKSEDGLAPLLNMVMVPLMLLSGIMLPMTLGPGCLQLAQGRPRSVHHQRLRTGERLSAAGAEHRVAVVPWPPRSADGRVSARTAIALIRVETSDPAPKALSQFASGWLPGHSITSR